MTAVAIANEIESQASSETKKTKPSTAPLAVIKIMKSGRGYFMSIREGDKNILAKIMGFENEASFTKATLDKKIFLEPEESMDVALAHAIDMIKQTGLRTNVCGNRKLSPVIRIW